MLKQATEILAFLTALLAFLMLVAKAWMPIWRKSKAVGRERYLIIFVLAVANLPVFLIGCLALLFEWDPFLAIGCQLGTLVLVVIGFLYEPRPVVTRWDIVSLLIGVITPIFFLASEMRLIETKVSAAKAKATAPAKP